ncbi:small, acid-soluble spore protein, alpha/beta type [Anaerobranca gottschalkii]|uniref:Small, acid-soluble spore protein, alpha/beta type n=1 Tax=Anaerobranca gottschalkii DSM 13577 TaxID=1120990 RepID=A0A1H9ZKW9_9FIRM|nr:small, acid-soluble spore protein, alpha/beta type [Anaerobranca gottschalkii]SES81984.1 Small, acid-soluble spore protein, alpha/beta type [Anaerobranca gottschalkii DSM 13577]
MAKRNKIMSEEILDQFKYEIAEQLGIRNKIETQGWANMTSYECGKIGGKIGGAMVKVMIKNAEKYLMENGKL